MYLSSSTGKLNDCLVTVILYFITRDLSNYRYTTGSNHPYHITKAILSSHFTIQISNERSIGQVYTLFDVDI